MVKIIFYEEINFQGHYYECSSDHDDLQSFFKSCNSIRIESGCWVIYEKPSFEGYQYILTQGEYPEYQHWMGFNDMISSCRTYRTTRGGSYRMKIYERPDFGGQMMEFKDDCPSVYDHFHYHDINSCQVMEGDWAFYEQPKYKGQQYFLRTGEYKRFSDWGALSSSVGSFKRITEF